LYALPTTPVDLALLLKAIPCLEQLDKAATGRLLETIPASHLLISFPMHSLGGRDVRMRAHYEAHFRALVEGRGWAVRRFAFETELVFRVDKP
jgi:16S rRNA (guanine(1405)-N(7))-methyltransferase